jgi:hypothetical protein
MRSETLEPARARTICTGNHVLRHEPSACGRCGAGLAGMLGYVSPPGVLAAHASAGS